MRKLIVSLLVLAFGLSSHSYAQLIAWSADRPLTWDDFKGEVPPDSKAAAAAACYASLNRSLKYSTADSTDIGVSCVFYTNLSWKRRNDLTPAKLKHEQLHFDIVELYARRIRKSFARYRSIHKHKFHTEAWLLRIYAQERKSMHRCERRYDKETRHSLNMAKQQYWETKIAQQLDELKGF